MFIEYVLNWNKSNIYFFVLLNIKQRFYPEGKADKYCNFVFKAFDTDNNNWIDFTEFL